MMLSVLQDKLFSFKNHIFAYSDISGGTLGANVFYALSADKINKGDGRDTVLTNGRKYIDLSRGFFRRDFLAPVIGTFLFGDALGYFCPVYIPKFDRGLALEKEWQSAWKDIMPYLNETKMNKMQLGAREMLEINPGDTHFKPVMFINSHEVETGRRAIYSNVQLDTTAFSAISNLNNKLYTDLPFSSAILLSARFPLISPAATINVDANIKRHYVDGGYFESSGTLTLYEALRSLESKLDTTKYDVFVIHLDSGEDVVESERKGISFLNEPAEILNGAVIDRSGHTEFAVDNLKNYVTRRYKESHYITIKVGGSLKAVPINWVLSGSAINQVIDRCKKELNAKKLSELIQTISQSYLSDPKFKPKAHIISR